MATKRLRNDSEPDSDNLLEDKRMRRLPSFATVIKEAVMAKYLQNFGMALEPLIRRVVKEEVESGLVRGARILQRSPQMHIEAAAEPSSLQLVFKKPLSLPIFTGSKIEDAENCPLEILLIGEKSLVDQLPSPLRIEVVVIDGDFDDDNWSASDFTKGIVRERTGRRPLLTGDVALTLRDGSAVIGELTFTDNSSWIRSRNFRIGARVVVVAPASYGGPRIREALTEPFMVKDHRGELYRKHYPPSLHDLVWRLERIGKDGAFHRKLSAANINTVQDFLKLWTLDPDQLRRILGVGMSDRVWEGTIAHARTCCMGEKRYLYSWGCWTLLLSPVCEVLGVLIDGMAYKPQDLNRPQQAHARELAREACRNWEALDEIDGLISGNAALLPNDHVLVTEGASSSNWAPCQQDSITPQLQIGELEEVIVSPNNLQLGFSAPIQNNTSCLTSLIQW